MQIRLAHIRYAAWGAFYWFAFFAAMSVIICISNGRTFVDFLWSASVAVFAGVIVFAHRLWRAFRGLPRNSRLGGDGAFSDGGGHHHASHDGGGDGGGD